MTADVEILGRSGNDACLAGCGLCIVGKNIVSALVARKTGCGECNCLVFSSVLGVELSGADNRYIFLIRIKHAVNCRYGCVCGGGLVINLILGCYFKARNGALFNVNISLS